MEPNKEKITDEKLINRLKDTSLLMTVQPCLPDMVTERYAEMVFEDFGFESLGLVTSHSMIYETSQHQR